MAPILALILTACLERVTWEKKALDPRFTVGAGDAGGSMAEPFSKVEGEKVLLRGTVESAGAGPVQVDIRVVDASAPGGNRQEGMLQLSGPGPFEIEAPPGVELLLEAFQDPEGDGPDGDDPYARAQVKVGEVEGPLALALVAGARAAAGGGPVSGGPPASESLSFPDHDGPWTTLRGRVESPREGAVVLDFRVRDPASPGGNRQLGRATVPEAGPYEVRVPADLGEVAIQAFQDPDGDGPGGADPYAEVHFSTGEDTVELEIRLVEGARGGEPAAGGGALFPELGASPVPVSGTITGGEGQVDLDLFAPDANSPGGRKMLGKLKVNGGTFTFQAPAGYGKIELEAFVDLDANGPSAADLRGRAEVVVGADPVEGLTITLEGP